METDGLIEEMASAPTGYRAVTANGTLSERSSTDEEMLDATMSTDTRFEYTDLADRSQGERHIHVIY